jgi:transposase
MKQLFLGADVSKGYCDFIIQDEELKEVEPHFQLDDIYEGHVALTRIIEKLFRTYADLTLYFGIESTGSYENNWFSMIWALKEAYNIKLIRLNPKYIYHQKKASFTKITTDKTSAISIAEYLKLHRDKLRFNEDRQYTDLRRLWTYLKLTKKQLIQCTNQLEKYLYTASPNILSHCKKHKPAWFYSILKKYPTAKKLSKAKISNLIKIPFITEKRAIELVNKAKSSIASFTSEIGERLILRVIEEIVVLRKIIKETEHDIIQLCNIPEVEILKTFKGIGDISACGLILEIERVQRFKSVKALASYFGVHPVFKESGDGVFCVKMSKEGRSEGRRILFNIVKSAIFYNEWMKDLYEDYQKKGKCKLSAMGILMHKILRIIYGMLKNKTQYSPQIDMANRIKFYKTKNKKIILINHKSRRFQKQNDDAPISRRQDKKRREQGASPNDSEIIHCGITAPALGNYNKSLGK